MSTEVLERPVAGPALLIGLAPLAVRLPTVVRLLTAAHAAAFLPTNGRLLGRGFGSRILIPETVGRLSTCATTPTSSSSPPTGVHPGTRAGGSTCGRPDTPSRCSAQTGSTSLPRVARGRERERLWRRLAAVTPVDAYQRHTIRFLPVVA